ncbi:tRNA dimethylallyltransferase [Venustampulla echinocandica]|uniref:tRNA dimethylallyltransferase n=1 Tax=Venustampulla echinocandica TaxID=2656787 RepID=A0A370TFN9_9HELO|nr:tRNA dimethylallyltransferase [Venustampulla echinocandica]RDL33718.1 tRNA dimethylallyltransferase [Venustampulla echinocandica]
MAAKPPKDPLLVVLGATGTGKSQLAVDLVNRFDGEIINGDAMQMREYHHLLGCIALDEEPWRVGLFKKKAGQIIKEIWSRGRLPIVVGGTHYCTQSLLFDDFLLKDQVEGEEQDHIEFFNEEIVEKFPILSGPTEDMIERLREVDPVMADRWHPKDRKDPTVSGDIPDNREESFSFEQGTTSQEDLQKLYELSIERTKAATRQYAKRQVRWIRLSLMPALAEDLDKLYLLDGTDISQWTDAVSQPAIDIAAKFLEGSERPSPYELSEIARNILAPASSRDEKPNLWFRKECQTCHMVAVNDVQWKTHLNGRRHRALTKKKRKSEASDRSSHPNRSGQSAGKKRRGWCAVPSVCIRKAPPMLRTY